MLDDKRSNEISHVQANKQRSAKGVRGITISQVAQVAEEVTKQRVTRGTALARIERDATFPQPICETEDGYKARVRLFDRQEVTDYLQTAAARKCWPMNWDSVSPKD